MASPEKKNNKRPWKTKKKNKNQISNRSWKIIIFKATQQKVIYSGHPNVMCQWEYFSSFTYCFVCVGLQVNIVSLSIARAIKSSSDVVNEANEIERGRAQTLSTVLSNEEKGKTHNKQGVEARELKSRQWK